MTLQPGCRFMVAPSFHLPVDWSRRLRLDDGANAGTLTGLSWRPPTGEELALLVPELNEATTEKESAACVCLFQLPNHIQAAWWKLLEPAEGTLGAGRLPGLDAFVAEITEFLAFKRLPLPQGACCEVVVSGAGERFVPHGRRPWGWLNLGEEEAVLVLMPSAGCELRLTLLPGEGGRLPQDDASLRCGLARHHEPALLMLISFEHHDGMDRVGA